MLAPNVNGFLVQRKSILRIALENGDVQPVLIDAISLRQEFPSPVDGFLLEIIAERPVAEHLEHGVVIGVHPHLFEVVVLAAHAQAFLGVRHAGRLRRAVAEKDVFERVHARIGEHQGGVILEHHRG